MAEPTLQDLIPMGDVPGIFKETFGRPVSRQSVHRWVHRGLGGARLRTVGRGRHRATTSKWIMEFLADSGRDEVDGASSGGT